MSSGNTSPAPPAGQRPLPMVAPSPWAASFPPPRMCPAEGEYGAGAYGTVPAAAPSLASVPPSTGCGMTRPREASSDGSADAAGPVPKRQAIMGGSADFSGMPVALPKAVPAPQLPHLASLSPTTLPYPPSVMSLRSEILRTESCFRSLDATLAASIGVAPASDHVRRAVAWSCMSLHDWLQDSVTIQANTICHFLCVSARACCICFFQI